MNEELNIDMYRMNRILRHRLRNLCAGVKMTVERISEITASAFPQIPARCHIIVSELENLQEFTHRMDLIFDKLPSPEEQTLFDIIAHLRSMFIKAFPLCSLELQGEEINVSFKQGSWILLALKELLFNAGEAAEDNKVSLLWKKNDKNLVFTILNKGIVDDTTILNSPSPFYTTKSKHDGLGLSIAYTIAKAVSGKLEISYSAEEKKISSVLMIP